MNTSKTVLALLVAYLPENGGWPNKVTHIGQDYDRELMFYGRGNVRTGIILDELAIDHRKCGEAGAKITREQYEAALTEKEHPLPWDEKTTDADGWIDWPGGECPVSDSTMVDVCYRDGAIHKAQRADSYEWGHGYAHFVTTGADIIAYRLHQPQEVAQTEAEQEADLNDCIGQAQSNDQARDEILYELANFAASTCTSLDIGAATQIAIWLSDKGYRKQ